MIRRCRESFYENWPNPPCPLPRYTRRKRLQKGRFGYFFDVPTWARKRGCPVENEPLGIDYDLAVQREEIAARVR